MQVIRTACVTTPHGSCASLADLVRITSNAALAASHGSNECLRANAPYFSAQNRISSAATGSSAHARSPAACSRRNRARSPAPDTYSGPAVFVVFVVMVSAPPGKQVHAPAPAAGASVIVVIADHLSSSRPGHAQRRREIGRASCREG